MAVFPTPTIRADRPSQANEVGTKPSKAGLTVDEFGFGALRCTRFTFQDMTVTMTDEAGVVLYGGQKIYDFPATGIRILAANADLELLGTGNVSASWDGDFSLGTATASNNATLTSTEQNIIPSTATPQADASKVTTANGLNTFTAITALTAGIGTANNTLQDCTSSYSEAAVENNFEDCAQKINEIIAVVNSMSVGSPMLDGTGTAPDLFLNFLVDDADHNGGGITVTSGTILVFWINTGAIFNT